MELGDSSYEPSDLSIDPKAVITVPKDAQFSDTDKNVVTKLRRIIRTEPWLFLSIPIMTGKSEKFT